MDNIQYKVLDKKTFVTTTNIQSNGKSKTVSRYLQKIPCKVNCEFGCNDNFKGLKIPQSVTNYVIVDTEYLINFSECLDLIDNVGFIITLSSLDYIQDHHRRLYFKLKSLYEDPAKSIRIFQNEFHIDCFIKQIDWEDSIDFVTRQNYMAAQFYLSHLLYKKNVVLLTGRTDVALLQYRNVMRKIGSDSGKIVEVMSFKQYLAEYQSENVSAIELIDRLEETIESIKQNVINMDVSEEVAQEYLPEEVLTASLKSGDFVQGYIRVNKYRSRDEATVVVSEGNSAKQNACQHGEISIMGQVNRNRAIDGDLVIIKLLPESQWINQNLEITDSEASAELTVPMGQDTDLSTSFVLMDNKTATGRIVGISKRNWRDYVCSFEKSDMNSGQYVLVTPFDRRIPRIRIGISSTDKLVNKRFVVRIDDWAVNSRYPHGHFVENLGEVGDLETETKTLLIEYKLYNRDFTPSQLAELPINTKENPWHMDAEDIAKRRDLRGQLIYSIDPIGCQDVDDALSIRTLENGNLELGVHIADVTHFVAPHSLLDLEARKRSTSIYMADRRFDMLPHVLSGDLCSLWSGVDRFAVSVTWELSSSLEVLSVDYFRSVIRSTYKLHYELAQDIYDNKVDFQKSLSIIPELMKSHQELGDGRIRFDELKKSIEMLLNVASVLKSRRIDAGGLELDSVEVQVKFSDPDRTQLEDLQQKAPLQMHETIAECMIFANHWVAKRCLKDYPLRACLRRHPQPRMDHFVELIHCAATKGFQIDFSSNLQLAKSLDAAVDNSNPETNRILRNLATMAMSNAQYFSTGTQRPEDFYHYGLALPTYTHFTSPIRRYADILVHRILLCAIEGVPEESLLTNTSLANQCDVMNHQHRQAQLVQRASIELFQAMFFRNKPLDDAARYTEGVIVKLRSNGFVVHIPRYGIKGSVFLQKHDKSIGWLSLDKAKPLPGNGSVFPVNWVSEEASIRIEKFRQSIDRIAVHRGADCQQYNLFDRVMLRIDVAVSNAHGMTLTLELVGTPAVTSSVVKAAVKTETQEGCTGSVSLETLYKSVRDASDDVIKKRKYVEEEEIDPNVAIARLHSNTSLYHLFRQFRQKKLGINDAF